MVLIMLLDHLQEVFLVRRNLLNVDAADRLVPEKTQVHCQQLRSALVIQHVHQTLGILAPTQTFTKVLNMLTW